MTCKSFIQGPKIQVIKNDILDIPSLKLSAFPGCFAAQGDPRIAAVPYITLFIFEAGAYYFTRINPELRNFIC
jgi:hypothetical protein